MRTIDGEPAWIGLLEEWAGASVEYKLQQNTHGGIDTVQQSEEMKVGNMELPTTIKTYIPTYSSSLFMSLWPTPILSQARLACNIAKNVVQVNNASEIASMADIMCHSNDM